MTLQVKYWVAALLGFSGIALSSLVPGGPIETRSFAHINPIALGLFNTFLTTLALGSLLLVYAVLRSERWAMLLAALCGLSFLSVYGLDLAYIFPVSPDAMPPTLLAIEVLGSIVSLPLMALSVRAWQVEQRKLAAAPFYPAAATALPQSAALLAAIGLGMVALGIIAFATKSAMGL